MTNSERKLAISHKTRRALAENSESVPPGAAHYSYGSVKEKFSRCFDVFGYRYFELDRPEIYPIDRSIYRNVVHVQFKPFDEIRLLRGVPNIAHVAWEFPTLPRQKDWAIGDKRRGMPFNDYVHMLKLPDEIWVGSRYAQAVLAENDISNVHFVPAPIFSVPRGVSRNINNFDDITDPILARIAGRLRHRRTWEFTRNNIRAILENDSSLRAASITEVLLRHRRVFLSVANPGDMRKNLPAALLAMRSVPQSENACLIVKLVIDNHYVDVKRAIREELFNRFRELELEIYDQDFSNVFLVPEFLSTDELSALYACSNFYLCTAFAEGQNLPLLEAMAAGVVPVSVYNTAMADYINSSNSIRIDCRLERAPRCFDLAYGITNMPLHMSSYKDALEGISTALNIDDEKRSQLAEHSIRTIEEIYSDRAVHEVVQSRLKFYW